MRYMITTVVTSVKSPMTAVDTVWSDPADAAPTRSAADDAGRAVPFMGHTPA